MISVQRNRLARLAALLGLLFAAAPTWAELVLTAPPREDVQEGQRVYGPIAEHLSEVLERTVVYRHPQSWPQYEASMKRDEFDIVFDGPHFAAWRIQNLSNQAVARLPGSLAFVLVVREDDPAQQPRDLVGERICSLPAPNLAGLTLYGMFPNPARQPEMSIIRQGGFREITRAFEEGKCRAAIYRKSFYQAHLPEQTKRSLRVIRESAPLLNQGITVSRRIGTSEREAIGRALTTPEGGEAVRALLERFAGKNQKIELAGTGDYQGYNLLHDQMVFGW